MTNSKSIWLLLTIIIIMDSTPTGVLITINETYWKKITVQSANIIMITHNLDYIQYIQNKYNFNLVLNDDKVTCCLILTGKLFHKNTPLCRHLAFTEIYM